LALISSQLNFLLPVLIVMSERMSITSEHTSLSCPERCVSFQLHHGLQAPFLPGDVVFFLQVAILLLLMMMMGLMI